MDDERFSLTAHRSRTFDLLESWTHIPGVLVDLHLTVIRSNVLARALTPGFSQDVNLARFTFLDPLVIRDGSLWSDASAQILGMLRESFDHHGTDRELLTIVDELSAESRDFSQVWPEELSSAIPAGKVTFVDTAVGPITLGYSLILFPGICDDILVAFRALDEPSQANLGRLIISIQGR